MGNLYLSNADSISQFAVKTFSAENAGHAGNPYDIVATVTFTHISTSTEIETQMYYDGGDTWRWRFCGTLAGGWSYTTASAEANLNNLSGTLSVIGNQTALGFWIANGSRYERQKGDGTQMGLIIAPWTNSLDFDHTDMEFFATQANIDNYLDEAETYGQRSIQMLPANHLLALGHLTHDTHSSVDPDPASFVILENMINAAHAKGMSVHIWLWGDEDRKWTPIGLSGGINGTVDQRLQRYICARLGALPGWTMSYGFDLFEWVTQAQLQTWRDYMYARLGWPRLLMARTEGALTTPTSLPVNSYATSITSGFYDEAVTELAKTPTRPSINEHRFVYLRDSAYDMQTTRRVMWQFMIAGGASAFWGANWTTNAKPPNPEQLRTFRDFWPGRLLAAMVPANSLTNGWALADTSDHYVFYREGAASVDLDLSGMTGSQTAIAVDTLLAYAEINIGPLTATNQTWTAPYSSDWVIAVGTFT